MTIEHSNKVDFISRNRQQGYVALTISDHLEWDEDNRKLLILQAKINGYLSFIRSGQLFETYPDAHGCDIHIKLRSIFRPNQQGLIFFERLTPIIEEAGFNFSWEVLRQN